MLPHFLSWTFLRRLGIALLVLWLGALGWARADDGTAAAPANLGSGLRQLAAWHETQARTLAAPQRRAAVAARVNQMHPRAQTDDAGRLVVDIRLDGSVSAAEIRRQLAPLGLVFIAEHPAPGTGGRPAAILSAYLPLESAVQAARTPGVFSISLVHRPYRRVGKVTSQGVGIMHVDQVFARGYDGTGITVGVLSDSYDLTTPHAADDIAADDLPGRGNPGGHLTPVFLLNEGSKSDPTNADEGRAMLQIVHDVAPGAALAFSTVGPTQGTFAAAIRGLRTNTAAHCDILVDDIGFPDEPFFSDSIVTKAVEDVVLRADLTGRPVIYYSAAGNQGDMGYDADFALVSNADARAGRAGTNNLHLEQVDVALTAGGFHNFEAAAGNAGAVGIVQRIKVSGTMAEVNLQWNDPFTPGFITTDYNLLVFDEAGNYLSAVSGTDDSFSTAQALEIVDLNLGPNDSDATYQLVISRRAAGAQAAGHLRYIVDTSGGFEGPYLRPNVPTLFGHSGARDGDGVGAYDYQHLNVTEDFTSLGPVTIYFDDSGNRLATPEIRQQPTIAGVDNVDTSFFPPGADSDGNGFPNFPGTSAAAPHVAGVAALLLQAGGGPGTVDFRRMRDVLTSTAGPHDLDPFASGARLVSRDGAAVVTLNANGDTSNNSASDSRFFRLHYDGPAGSELRGVRIDLTAPGEQFDGSTTLGYPFTIAGAEGGVNTGRARASISGPNRTNGTSNNTMLTLSFPPGVFPSGGTIFFGIDRDQLDTGRGGNSADQLDGAAVSADFRNAGGGNYRLNARGTLRNNIGFGYSPADGFGLVNAAAALTKLLGR